MSEQAAATKAKDLKSFKVYFVLSYASTVLASIRPLATMAMDAFWPRVNLKKVLAALPLQRSDLMRVARN